jgi:hypothetical protein
VAVDSAGVAALGDDGVLCCELWQANSMRQKANTTNVFSQSHFMPGIVSLDWREFNPQ